MKYVLNIEDFNEIVNGVKLLKTKYVCVVGNTLIGSDDQGTFISTYQMNRVIPLQPFTLITKELKTEFYNNITDTTIIIDTDICKLYCHNNLSYIEKCDPMIDLYYAQLLLMKYDSLNRNISNRQTITYTKEITNDINFLDIQAMKSSDGARLYIPEGGEQYGMYLYKGIIPVNKNDKVFITVYDYGATFISNFTIYKKKMNPVNVYFRFVKL